MAILLALKYTLTHDNILLVTVVISLLTELLLIKGTRHNVGNSMQLNIILLKEKDQVKPQQL